MSKGEILETMILFAAIGSLWPMILGWQHWTAKAAPVLSLPVLIWMAVTRLRRFNKALGDAFEERKGQG